MLLPRFSKKLSERIYCLFCAEKRYRVLLIKMSSMGLMITFLYGVLESHIGFVKTLTPSLPYQYFVIMKRSLGCTDVPQKDFYIFFEHQDAPLKVMKQVKGIPGSTLRYDLKGNLWVDDFCVGIPRKESSTGERLNPIPAGIIPKGFVFGYASHAKSFDSRYENFGLIPIRSIKGVGVAVL